VSTTSIVTDSGGFVTPPVTLAEIPTMGKIDFLFCGTAAQNSEMRVRILSDDDSEPFTAIGKVIAGRGPAGTNSPNKIDFTGGTFSSGGGEPLRTAGVTPGPFGLVGFWEWELWRPGEVAGAHVVVNAHNSSGTLSGQGQGRCLVRTTTILEG
jgi:hypothetical protein